MIGDTVTLSHVICFIILNSFNLALLKSFVATVVYYTIWNRLSCNIRNQFLCRLPNTTPWDIKPKNGVQLFYQTVLILASDFSRTADSIFTPDPLFRSGEVVSWITQQRLQYKRILCFLYSICWSVFPFVKSKWGFHPQTAGGPLAKSSPGPQSNDTTEESPGEVVTDEVPEEARATGSNWGARGLAGKHL